MERNSEIVRADAGSTVVLVVDLQERLMAAIHEGQAVLEGARKLIESARLLELPVLATEQYPAGLGRTCPAIAQCLEGVRIVEKMRFSACVPGVLEQFGQIGRRNVLMAGVETHVCVQQTAFDLLEAGLRPILCADATGSRRALDRDVALERMRAAGVTVSTVESVIFEMLGEAGGEQFKRVLKILK